MADESGGDLAAVVLAVAEARAELDPHQQKTVGDTMRVFAAYMQERITTIEHELAAMKAALAHLTGSPP